MQVISSHSTPARAPGIPFRTAEEAWLWFICAVEARAEGAVPGGGRGDIPRPCEPVDIYTIIIAPENSAKIMAGMADLSTIWGVGLAVLGIYVYRRGGAGKK